MLLGVQVSHGRFFIVVYRLNELNIHFYRLLQRCREIGTLCIFTSFRSANYRNHNSEHFFLSSSSLSNDRQIFRQDLNNSPLTLPLFLHTKKEIEATLPFTTRTRLGTRK
jgi:hypothetical protein